ESTWARDSTGRPTAPRGSASLCARTTGHRTRGTPLPEGPTAPRSTDPAAFVSSLRGLDVPGVGPSGVEPLTSRSSAVRPNHLSYGPPPSLPLALRSFARPEFLVLPLVVELVIQIVVLIEVIQVLVLQLVLVQVLVEVLVQVLVLFEVFELLIAETVATTLERPVRRVTGQHCHPQLRLWLQVSNEQVAVRATVPPPPAPRDARVCGVPTRAARVCATAGTTASPRSTRRPRCIRARAPT